MTRLPLARYFGPDSVIARGPGTAVTLRQMLGDIEALARTLPERKYVINLCEDRYLFLTGLAAAMVRSQVSLLPSAWTPHALYELAEVYPDLYCLCERPDRIPEGLEKVFGHSIASMNCPSTTMPAFPADQRAVIVFTSGSTGRARPNPKSWGSLVHGATIANSRFGLTSGRPGNIVSTVPPQHMYGFETTVMLPLQTGYAFHSARPFFPEDIRSSLEELEAPRILVTTPLHLRACVHSGQPLPPLHSIISATAPLSPQLACAAETRYDTQVLEIFGFTEAGSIASRRTVEGEEWRTYDGVFLRTIDGGTLVVEGGHLAAPVPANDVIEVRDPQRFVLQGRYADLITLAGKRASLSDLTHKLLQVKGVIDGVFFMPDEVQEPITRPLAFAVAPGMTAAEILKELRHYIDPVFLPRPLILLDALPRNAVGKLPRETLVKLAAQGER